MGDSKFGSSRLSLLESLSEVWGSFVWLLLFPVSKDVFLCANGLRRRGSVRFKCLLKGRESVTSGDKLLSLQDLLGSGGATLEELNGST